MPDPAAATPESPAKKPRRAGCWKKLCLLGGSLLFTLLLAELLVRAFSDELLPSPMGPRYLYQNDPVMGIDLVPDFRGRFKLPGEFDTAIQTNSKGCRDREFQQKAQGSKRVMVLGDSFAFGFGVEAEEAFPQVCEGLLAERLGAGKVEVLNVSAPGRGLPHMRRGFAKHQPWFGADVVVATFFYVNDLSDIRDFPQHAVRGGLVLTKGFAAAVDDSAWLRFSVHYSQLSLLAFRAWFNLQEAQRGSSFRLGEPPQFDPKAGWATMPFRLRAAAGNEAQVQQLAERKVLWGRFDEQLQLLRDEVMATGAQLVLMSIPQPPQTQDAVWNKMLAAPGVEAGQLDRELISKTLAAICRERSVRFLDLVPVFRASPAGGARFFPGNRHFTVRGNADAARALADDLQAAGLLPR